MTVPLATSSMRFGNYEVLTRPDGKPDELGRGGFGRTYRARHVFLGTEVALKVIIDRLAEDDTAKKRFLKEAREHARLNHPGIARITDFGEAEGTFFYAMELCRDGDLKEYVKKKGPLPVAEALELVRQVAEALNYAHGHGIVHRDVKPSNLLLVMEPGMPPQVKLIDFGLVRKIAQAADETIDTTAAAQWSPVFASPEQIRELPLDERTDIFSLGMTAWYLLRGSGPVDGNTHEIVAERLNRDSYEERLPANLQGPARQVVARMVEKDTSNRYRKGSELLEGLRQILNGAGAPVPARPPQRITDRFMLQPAGREYAGEVFRGADSATGQRVKVIRVYREHEPATLHAAEETVKKLVAAQSPGLVRILEMTEFTDGVVIVEEDVSGPSVEDTLRREGAVPLIRLAPLLWDAATGVDTAMACGALPTALERAVLKGAEKSPVDWSTVQIQIPLKIIADGEGSAQDADVTAATAPVSPLKSFASLLYLAAGGRHVRPQAMYSSAACIPISGLSSGGNRLLATALSGESKPDNCLALLQSVLTAESVPVETVARRAKERQQRTASERAAQDTSGSGARAATGPPASVSQTVAAAATRTGSASAPAGLTESERTASLARIETAARQAKEASDQTLRVKLPPGFDDSVLCQHQIESRKWAREAAQALQRAQESTRTGRYDHSAAKELTDSAHAAAAEAARLLALARGLAADAGKNEEETRYEVPQATTEPVALPPPIRAQIPPPMPPEAAPAPVSAPAPQPAVAMPVQTPVTRPAVTAERPAPVPHPQPAVTTPAPAPVQPARQATNVPSPAPVAAPAPVPLIIPPQHHAGAKKKSPVGALVALLAIAAAGGGGYYYYDQQQKKKKEAADVKNKDEKKEKEADDGKKPENTNNHNGQQTNNKEHGIGQTEIGKNGTDVKNIKITPPEPPKKREVTIIFTGELPDHDGAISFKDVENTPTPAMSAGAMEYKLVLPPNAPDPEPVLNPKKFTKKQVSNADNRITYKLTRAQQPDTLRLIGLHARDLSAVTVGGRKGRTVPNTSSSEVMDLLITNAADENGDFRLDTQTWKLDGEVEKDDTGVWWAEMELALQAVDLIQKKGAPNPWNAVIFTAVNPAVMPVLNETEEIVKATGATTAGPDDLTFSLELGVPESIRLPAGEWKVEWKPKKLTNPSKTGKPISVKADALFKLEVP